MLAKKRHPARPGLYLALFVCLLYGCREKAAPAPSWPEVRYMKVTEERITLTRELPGRVSAFTSSEVRPQVSGIIQARLFEEGTDVRAGQELYRMTRPCIRRPSRPPGQIWPEARPMKRRRGCVPSGTGVYPNLTTCRSRTSYSKTSDFFRGYEAGKKIPLSPPVENAGDEAGRKRALT
ncbi:MAG: hypothetical protein LBB60_05800 [Desulfovibrio sp.]|jgi:hypothetical protein|nr:hypothetical protein [Desulfovibrio sp.]